MVCIYTYLFLVSITIMWLHLISHPPTPMMLFTISFMPADLHPLPLNWVSQFAMLSTADLSNPAQYMCLIHLPGSQRFLRKSSLMSFHLPYLLFSPMAIWRTA